MDYDLGENAGQLRLHLRELIATHMPDDFIGACTDDPDDLATTQRFCKVLAGEGLLARAWPIEFGGSGSVWEQTVVREEMWAHHEPRGPQYMGINWVGPAIMRFGTEEQRAQHLPAIAAGDVVWCQGFSEPDAGSDLASLRTRAVPDGDGWRITGQKIWTSYALMAQWLIVAARTSVERAKQAGITMFLVPMDREGILARPIDSMLGPHHLNELFLDDVRAEAGEVLGEVGRGWQVIRDALAFERVGIARYARCDRLLALVRDALADRWDDLPTSVRTRWLQARINVRIARLLAYHTVDAQARGVVTDADASVARIAATTCDQSVAELLFELLGPQALDDGTSSAAILHGAVEDHWRYAQAATVASGTIEIQRMLVSRAALNGARG
jgi:alkylation response protein AidB-like acyl-CoA dehydrogenase